MDTDRVRSWSVSSNQTATMHSSERRFISVWELLLPGSRSLPCCSSVRRPRSMRASRFTKRALSVSWPRGWDIPPPSFQSGPLSVPKRAHCSPLLTLRR
jgi:hypothetical protein